MPYYKQEPQSELENSLYRDRSTCNNTPDIVLLHKTIKEAAIRKSQPSQPPHRQAAKYTGLIEELKKPVTTTNDIGNNVQLDVTIYFILTNH
jgi:hypothetical protein